MPRPMTVSDTVVIAADPQTVYEAVADPTRTSAWSPENTGARVADPASGSPAGALPVGTVFTGRNRRRWMRWTTRCRVTAADPGRCFEFRVEAIGVRRPIIATPIATWRYDLEPDAGGTRVTETWRDARTMSDRGAKVFDRLATGSSFAEFNAANIRTTLDRLKSALESSDGGS